MQRIVNDPDDLVDEMVEGFKLTHHDIVAPTGNPRVLKYVNAPVPGKVGIVTGGGSGHKPAFIGYIGENMIDAVAVGEIFSSPTGRSFYDAIKAADSGEGVAVLYGNYSGDNMNVKMAKAEAEDDDIVVKSVVANDDVPSAPASERNKRRGVAGEILMWKVGGAKAAMGANLDEQIEPGKMELGIGHHGEPGIKVGDLKTADEMAEMCLDTILPDLPFAAGDEVVALVSGLGATPVSELYVFYRKVNQILGSKNITVFKSYVGNYFTSLEMMGVTLTLMKVDSELKTLINYKANSVALKQF